MDSLADVTERIASLFAELNIEVSSPEDDLFESGVMDSLVLVEFLTRLEQRMGISVPIEELQPDDLRSVQRISALVLARQSREQE